MAAGGGAAKWRQLAPRAGAKCCPRHPITPNVACVELAADGARPNLRWLPRQPGAGSGMVLRTLLCLAVLLGPAMALDRLDLSKSGWQLENAGSPAVNLADVRLPASVLPALHRAGIVQDPLWRWAEPGAGLPTL